MIEKFNRSQFIGENYHGFIHGTMGERDCNIYCNSVSGTIESGALPSVPLDCRMARMNAQVYNQRVIYGESFQSPRPMRG